MPITFALHGDTINAYFSNADVVPTFCDNGTAQSVTSFAVTSTGVINDRCLDHAHSSGAANILEYAMNADTINLGEFTILHRIRANKAGFPASSSSFFHFPIGGEPFYFRFSQLTNGLISIRNTGDNAATILNNNSPTAWTMTGFQVYDFVWQWNGKAASPLTLKIDDVLFASFTATANIVAANNVPRSIRFGLGLAAYDCSVWTNEFVIWNSSSINTSAVLLANGTTTALNGASRNSFVDVAATVADTDPGVANVLSATSYVFGGTTLTGTYNPPASTDPGVGNVRLNTEYLINDATLTGTATITSSTDPGIANVKKDTEYLINDATLTGTLESTNPGATNVAAGTQYLIESTTFTGSAVLLTAGQGASGTLDLNNIKEQIQLILENANTTTASPVNLSANLANSVTVQTIRKINPDKIPTQLSLFPYISIYIDDKTVSHDTMSVNQRTGRRKAEIDVKIMGIVFNENHTVDDEDPADNDIEYLMENIELTLRAFQKLGGSPVYNSHPEGTEYYRGAIKDSEETHVRTGILTLKVTAFY